jgi:hypothetical protein
MKKTVEIKKTSETSPNKVPERNNVEPPAKRNPKILQRDQIRLRFHQLINQVFLPIGTLMDKPEAQSSSKASTTFILEGELAKLKIPIPLSEMMRKNTYRS